MNAVEPAESPPPKSRKEDGLKLGYLYLSSFNNRIAVENVLGARLSK